MSGDRMTYRAGSCVVCGQGTDTALGSEGEHEWHVAFVTLLGVPKRKAAGTVMACLREGGFEPQTPRSVPAGRYTVVVRVCVACATDAGAPITPALFVPGARLPRAQRQARNG